LRWRKGGDRRGELGGSLRAIKGRVAQVALERLDCGQDQHIGIRYARLERIQFIRQHTTLESFGKLPLKPDRV
jgi:hypothetical protein